MIISPKILGLAADLKKMAFKTYFLTTADFSMVMTYKRTGCLILTNKIFQLIY